MNNRVPKESETIAARRSKRLLEKIRKTKSGFIDKRAWWSNGFFEALIVAFLLLLNLYLADPFFEKVASATSFSGPIIPLLSKAIQAFLVPADYAYQFVNIFFFLLFPLTFYIFVKEVTKRKLVAILATLFVSLPIFPFAKTRVLTAFFGVEGPHIGSLAILPLAIYGLLSFLHKGGVKNLVTASFSSALVALISPFGLLVFSIFAAITTFSEVLLGKGRLKILRFLMVFAVSFGLTSFWYNPAFLYWMAVGPMGMELREMVSRLIPILLFLLPVLGAFGYLLFDRKPDLQPLFLASFYTITFAVIIIVGGGFFPSHPNRYIPEFGISFAFLSGLGVLKLSESLGVKKTAVSRFRKGSVFMRVAFLLPLTLLAVLIIVFGRNALVLPGERVLGIWTGIERGEIWVAKDQFQGTFFYLGYIISSVTSLGLVFLGSMPFFRKREH